VTRTEPSTETLVRYLQGEMTRSESEEAERAIADSRRAQERVAELRAMMDDLRQPPAWAESIDLVEPLAARLASGEGAASPVARRRAPRWALAAGASGVAVAAAAALFAIVSPGDNGRGASPEAREPTEATTRRKGGAAPADPDRWVAIRVARAGRGVASEPVAEGARLAPGELEVSYTNLGPQPYAYLMVFAVDAGGEVRWLYPAYERAGTDPAAIAIARGASDRLLPDRVEHDFAAGRLALCGLFLRRPLTVSQVESALGGQQPAPGHRLPFRSSGQHCFDLEVE
jgi:hypothetical protein